MQLLHTLIIIFALSSHGYCQFFYNYEQAEPGENQRRSHSSSEENEKYEPDKREIRTVSERPQRINSPPMSSETQDVQPRRPRIRKYRKILREGEYMQPPQPPAVYTPSVFENIGLGEAPSGVYIPQDSLLNILKNPRYNREIPVSQYQTLQTVPQYNNYQGPNLQNNEPEYKFFVEPPVSFQPRPQQNPISNIEQPNVQYASRYPVNTSLQERNNESTETVPRRRITQTTRRVQQRRPAPEVDIDALRTYPDAMPYDVQYTAPEVQPVTQPKSVSRSSRRRTRVQIYDEPTQPPRAYGPSVFQDVGLGEAPEGVHIPEDSLLNILRDPARTQSQPRYAAQDSSQTQHGTYMPQQNYLQPTTVEALEPQRTSRRQSRQRTRSSRTSVRNTERQAEYPTNNEDQDFARIAPASSQNQRKRQTNNEDSMVNRRQKVNQAESWQSRRRQQQRTQHKKSEVSYV